MPGASACVPIDVEFHLMEGGHRFPSKAGPLVERWIARVF